MSLAYRTPRLVHLEAGCHVLFICGRLQGCHKCALEGANSSGPNLCKICHWAMA